MFTACESAPRGPVPINTDDACAFCRMAISQRRYAAELLGQDGNVYKFDDLACMLRFAHAHREQPQAAKFYVMDYATGKDWLDARHAYFLRLGTSSSSPMASGLVAFRNIDETASVTARKLSPPLTFEALWVKDVNEVVGRLQPRP